MKTRLPIALLAMLMVAPWLGQAAFAQDLDGTWFIRPKAGISYYLGDNDQKLNFQKGDLFNVTPIHGALEVGYYFNNTLSLSGAFSYSRYGNINDFDRNPNTSADEDGTFVGLQLLARKRFGTGKVAPYIQGGLGVLAGKGGHFPGGPGSTTHTHYPYGPLGGVGVDFQVSDNISLALESGGVYTFSDHRADGTGNQNARDASGFSEGDWLGWNTLGLTYNLKKFTPVMVTDLICPADVVATGEAMTFTGSVNEDATAPVTASWDFGDGARASGMTASHAFSRAGTYDVTFTAANGNGKGMDSRSCSVTVEDPCDAAEIVSMTSSTMSPDTRTSVRYSANVTGTAAIEYAWDFGDGNTSSSANPSHTYAQAGTYTVKLTVTNCGGTVERTMSISVVPYEAAICREIEEMNPVFFARNSSTLTPEARAKLQENLEILRECPNLSARIEGWAAPGERRAQQLSLDRAKAVEQFYVDNGIAVSRLMTVGMGRAMGMTSKKEGLAGYQRADTIPVRN